MTEEQKHNHIKEIAEDYVSKSWNILSDLHGTDLVLAGIGVGKIIAKEYEDENAELKKQNERAKECMKKLLFIINSDPSNYNCKGLIQDAEDFIYNRTCHIRQLGEHCITEERCIMCDE